jgi:hypothetical protein
MKSSPRGEQDIGDFTGNKENLQLEIRIITVTVSFFFAEVSSPEGAKVGEGEREQAGGEAPDQRHGL